MKTSNFVGAVMAVAIVGGGALALAKNSENTLINAREAVCNSKVLNTTEQDSCRTQMKGAKSEVAKQQIVTRFQSKIDIREATDYGSAAKSSSGGVSEPPASTRPTNDTPTKAEPANTMTPVAPKK